MSKVVIPNMPPLSSIEDNNTRMAIQALIDGWRVRNGEVGDGEHKFLTAGDLGDMLKASGNGSGGNLGTPGSSLAWISNLMARIDASIQQSFLWRKLGERIEWIETPEWFQGKFGAAIRQETIERQTANAALSSQLTTAVSNINRNISLVQQELTATSDMAGASARAITQLQNDVGGVRTTAQNALSLATTTEGSIRGAWTVKFDADGYVAGAGLGLEGKDGHYSSSFYVRADSFAVGSPEVPNIPPMTPFKVFSSDTTLPDGTYIRAGVYIDSAMVSSLNLIGNNNFNVRSGMTGARMEMNSKVIKVYDSANVLRVKIGDLDA